MHLRLKKLERSHLETLHRWLNTEAALGAFDEVSFPTVEALQKNFEQGAYKNTWIVDLGETSIGYANFAVHPWDEWIACIGVVIAEPNFRGKGYGTQVHRLLTTTIFSVHPEIQKLEAFTDVENIPEKRALEKASFFLEGTQKRKNRLRNQFRDMHVYAFLRPASNSATAIQALDIPPRTKPSNYPEPFFSRMAGREKRQLGDFFGIKNFGVNLTRLQPKAESALLHRHSTQDEFIFILEGTPTLVTEVEEILLGPGMCAGFPAKGAAHQLVNRTDREVLYLEVGDRSPGDEGTYPRDDLKAVLNAEGKWVFTHKDGTPY